MCVNQPSSLPTFLRMAGLAIAVELVGVRISMALLACFPEPDKLRVGKFRAFSYTVAFDAFNGIVLSPERERSITAVSINQPSACPALFGMTGFTAFFKLVVVWVTVAFSTTDANTIENKLRALAGIRLGCMAILAWRIGMFASSRNLLSRSWTKRRVGPFQPAGV